MLFKTHQRRPRAVVARHSLSSLLLAAALALSQAAFAESLHSGNVQSPGFIAQIQSHDANELSAILGRLDILLKSGNEFPSSQPLALVLHGEEVRAFLRSNYTENSDLVDLAARLDAFDAVQIQVCETWLRDAQIEKSELPPFIDTVPYGPAQEKALLEQGYEFF